jgi:hypothetical protein
LLNITLNYYLHALLHGLFSQPFRANHTLLLLFWWWGLSALQPWGLIVL